MQAGQDSDGGVGGTENMCTLHAVTAQRREKIQLGIPRCDVLQRKDADRSDTMTTMLGAPGWLKDFADTSMVGAFGAGQCDGAGKLSMHPF